MELSDIRTAAVIIGGVFGALIGDLNGLLIALLVLMALDYTTGILVGWTRKNLNSEVGFVGLARKGLILALVIVANMLDAHVIGNGSACRGVVISFYLANEGLSIVENAGKLGVPVPEKLLGALEQLRGKGEDHKEDSKR